LKKETVVERKAARVSPRNNPSIGSPPVGFQKKKYGKLNRKTKEEKPIGQPLEEALQGGKVQLSEGV